MRRFDDEEWARVREAGRGRFLLMQGVLGRGLPLGALMTFVIAGVERNMPASLVMRNCARR